MNEFNMHTISNLKEYVSLYGLPKVKIRGLFAIDESALKSLPGKPMLLVKYHRNSKNPY